MDPSEQSAVSYFLGLTVSKLAVWNLSDVRTPVHLDIYEPMVGIPRMRGERPDMVGLSYALNGWVVIEAKGRVRRPSPAARIKAKAQAQRQLPLPIVMRVAVFSWFNNQVLSVEVDDSPAKGKGGHFENEESFRHRLSALRIYYEPLLNFIGRDRAALYLQRRLPMKFEQADVEVVVHPDLLDCPLHENYDAAEEALRAAPEWLPESLAQTERKLHGHGVAVVPGPTWFARE